MFLNFFSLIFLSSSTAIAENSCVLQKMEAKQEQIELQETDLSGLFAQTKGCFTVIELWASWCGPCVKIAPDVEEFQTKYPDILFLSISADAAASKAEQFWKQYPPPKQKWRLKAWSLEGLSTEYKTIGATFPGKIPYFVVLSPEGTLLLELTEPKDLAALEKLVETNVETNVETKREK